MEESNKFPSLPKILLELKRILEFDLPDVKKDDGGKEADETYSKRTHS